MCSGESNDGDLPMHLCPCCHRLDNTIHLHFHMHATSRIVPSASAALPRLSARSLMRLGYLRHWIPSFSLDQAMTHSMVLA